MNNPVYTRIITQRNYRIHQETHGDKSDPSCRVCGDYEFRLMNKMRRDAE